MSQYSIGDRVIVPDPQRVNPGLMGVRGSGLQPHGPGEIIDITPAKYAGGSPMLTVRLDTGAERRIGALFVTREEA